MHLCNKVDRKSIEGAVDRIDDPSTRTRLLAGLVRFSPDIHTLLLYLSSLKDSFPRLEAAAALSSGIKQIDFSKVSAAQMRRVLELILGIFEKKEIPHLVLALLQSKSFRNAFDSVDSMPHEVAEIFRPLRAIYGVVFDGAKSRDKKGTLDKGLQLVLNVPGEYLQSYPAPVRKRLLIQGLNLANPHKENDKAINFLMETFPKKEPIYGELALRRAKQLLLSHEDEKAKRILAQLSKHHPTLRQAQRWLKAMEKPKLGRIALIDFQGPIKSANPRRIYSGLWLDYQKDVWVQIGKTNEKNFGKLWKLQSEISLPGLLPVLTGGGTNVGISYVATPRRGKLAKDVLKKKQLRPSDAFRLAEDGVAILSGLAQAGILLGDFDVNRLLIENHHRLWLARICGATKSDPERAATAHVALAKKWVRRVFDSVAKEAIQSQGQTIVDAAKDLTSLAKTLARAK